MIVAARRASTSTSASTGSTNAVIVRSSEVPSSPTDRTGFPIPAVVAVDAGRSDARPAWSVPAVAAPEDRGDHGGHAGVHAGLPDEQQSARERMHDGPGDVQQVVNPRDLVADEVGHEQDGEDRDARVARQRPERLPEIDDAGAVEYGGDQQRQVGVQPGGAGQADRGEDAADGGGDVHPGAD